MPKPGNLGEFNLIKSAPFCVNICSILSRVLTSEKTYKTDKIKVNIIINFVILDEKIRLIDICEVLPIL